MSDDKPREYTIEEIRTMLFDKLNLMIDYWDGFKDKSSREKLEGLAFSFLSDLDGESGNLPPFLLVPDPHPEDKEYHKSEGENWFPPILDSTYKKLKALLHPHHEYWCDYLRNKPKPIVQSAPKLTFPIRLN